MSASSFFSKLGQVLLALEEIGISTEPVVAAINPAAGAVETTVLTIGEAIAKVIMNHAQTPDTTTPVAPVATAKPVAPVATEKPVAPVATEKPDAPVAHVAAVATFPR